MEGAPEGDEVVNNDAAAADGAEDANDAAAASGGGVEKTDATAAADGGAVETNDAAAAGDGVETTDDAAAAADGGGETIPPSGAGAVEPPSDDGAVESTREEAVEPAPEEGGAAEEGAAPEADAEAATAEEASAAADEAAAAAALSRLAAQSRIPPGLALPSMAAFAGQGALLASAAAGLLGVKRHAPPYVSEADVLFSLRTHNAAISQALREGARRDAELEAAREESRRLAASLDEAHAYARAQAALLQSALARVSQSETDVKRLQAQVSSLDALERTVEAHESRLGGLDEDVAETKRNAYQRLDALDGRALKLEDSAYAAAARAATFEDRLDRLPSDLRLPAASILLPAELQAPADDGIGDESSADVSLLTHLLGALRDALEADAGQLVDQRQILADHEALIEGKADVGVEDVLAQHAAHLLSVQAKMDADALVDLPTLYAAQQEATEALRQILEGMQSKVGYDDVDYKVEQRYKEILAYLEQALHTTEGDDEDVRKETADLRKTLSTFAATKADRNDVQALRSQVASAAEAQRRAFDAEALRRDLAARPLRTEMHLALLDRVTAADLHRALHPESDDGATERRQNGHDGDGQNGGAAMSRTLSPHRAQKAAATCRHVADAARPGSAPHCLSCDTPLINAAAQQQRVLGGGYVVSLGALGQVRSPHCAAPQPASLRIRAMQPPLSDSRSLGHVGHAALLLPTLHGRAPEANQYQLSTPPLRDAAPGPFGDGP
ncbi:hypothetical protein M885DRAFT_585699 [Pelagophyceae sp. CCMP2097]|nr:hypothetical protein M885DRAFT_585699 [Pelagophyceae sp. CCMP2097]